MDFFHNLGFFFLNASLSSIDLQDLQEAVVGGISDALTVQFASLVQRPWHVGTPCTNIVTSRVTDL